jgi:hypothetical protein
LPLVDGIGVGCTNQSHCPYQAAACLQHPGIREVLPMVARGRVRFTNQSQCPLGYNEFDFFENEEHRPCDGCKIEI